MSKRITIVGDMGSCWKGKKEYARKLVDLGKESGLDVIKCQLFTGEEYTKSGNIEMKLDFFKELFLYGQSIGMPMAASVFNKEALEFVFKIPDMHHIKFAYSMRSSPMIFGALNIGRKVVVTTNIHDAIETPNDENLVKLMTQPRCKHADEYAILSKTNFEGLFPYRFQGFSDHSLGYTEALSAIKHGATWIEKHITLDYVDCLDVPDGRFALRPDELKEFIDKVTDNDPLRLKNRTDKGDTFYDRVKNVFVRNE